MEKCTFDNTAADYVQTSRAYPKGHGNPAGAWTFIGIECFLLILDFMYLFQDKLALNITTEQGKTLKDAQGDVFRGLGQFSIIIFIVFTNFILSWMPWEAMVMPPLWFLELYFITEIRVWPV